MMNYSETRLCECGTRFSGSCCPDCDVWGSLASVNGSAIATSAAAYVRLGLAPIAVHGLRPGGGCTCGDECPARPGKHPLSPKWERQLIDLTALERSLTGNPYLNLGLRMGTQPSGVHLVAIDVDGDRGRESLLALPGIPPTLEARTGSGGSHFIFESPDPLPNRVALRPGIDVRGQGGQIVVSPSAHYSGGAYSWIRAMRPASIPVDWLRTLEEPPHEARQSNAGAYGATALSREASRVSAAAEGQRAVTLYAASYAIGRLVAGGEVSEDDAERELTAAGLSCGLAPSEVRHAVESGLRRSEDRPRQAPLRQEPVSQSVLVAPPPPADPWHVVGTEDLLRKPLPAPTWACRGLDLLPGRPTGLWGKPGAGKTETAQALALSVASGTLAFEALATTAGRVVHLSYDFGIWAVSTRYRQLANGHGLSLEDLQGRLVVSAFPDAYLNTAGIQEALERLSDGATLMVLDCLRDALPGVDENDSDIATYLKILARVSERTGVAVLYLHHHKKGAEEDDIDGGRGSGAIAAASGAVWSLVGQGSEPRKMTQIRCSDASSGLRDPLWLVRETWPEPMDPFPCAHQPVRMVARNAEEMALRAQVARNDAAGPVIEKYEEQVLSLVRTYPLNSRRKLEELARAAGICGRASKFRTAVDSLVERGEVLEETHRAHNGRVSTLLRISASG